MKEILCSGLSWYARSHFRSHYEPRAITEGAPDSPTFWSSLFSIFFLQGIAKLNIILCLFLDNLSRRNNHHI